MILIRIISTVATLAQMVFLALALFEPVPSFAETFSVSTAGFSLRFEVGQDRRLYQQPIGGGTANPERADEAYPQAGDGYIWEPALKAIHADGNTSTDLLFEGMTRTNEGTGCELLRIQLRDPAYPFEVLLCFGPSLCGCRRTMGGDPSSRAHGGQTGANDLFSLAADANQSPSHSFPWRLDRRDEPGF